uniref:NADH dehydrogenase subunit 6 n=1 Tax=Gammarus duebeni TaxID=178002 RepID=H9M5R9_9CRUS|nr:NADH dehydrogenase subunit 6 [Gammarus duebeni]AER12198.1 NADH dehydrogenase subunit 6 [Gammarus duebeni]
MVKMFSLMSSFLSILFVFSSTPLVMAVLIVTQALLVSFITFTMLLTSWFSFILLMVFVSAMMVIFVYVSSLASNDFFSSNSYTNLSVMALIFTVIYMFTPVPGPSFFSATYSQLAMSDADMAPLAAYKIYAPYVLIITAFLIVYLLTALIVVAKNSSSSAGALRSLNQ